MGKFAVKKIFRFEAAHRLFKDQGDCHNLHGHSYTAIIKLEAPTVDDADMLVNFRLIKRDIGGWLDNYWDHAVLLNETDPLLSLIQKELKEGLKLFTFNGDPTAENMARVLVDAALNSEIISGAKAYRELRVKWVEIHETATSVARYTLDKNS